MYFSASAAPGQFGLWRTDGTAAGTQPVKGGLIIDELLVSGSVLYLIADDGTPGAERWKSNGTAAGTVLVKDIYPGSGAGMRPGLVDFNGTLFFAATDGVTGPELWRSDGTEAGTTLVKEIAAGDLGVPLVIHYGDRSSRPMPLLLAPPQ